jgi:hypothetical protein
LHDGGKFLLEGLRAPEPLWHLRLPSLLVATAAGIVLAARRRSAHDALTSARTAELARCSRA